MAPRSTENHCTPMARPGMRCAGASSGRRKRRDEIRAGAPIAADRELHLRHALRHVGRLRRQQTVADHIERQPPGGARGHRDRHRVARRVVALVERDFEHVGRIGIGFDIEAGVERDRCQRTVRIGGRDFKPIAAEIHRQRNARRLVERRVDRAVGDAFGGLDRLVIPAAVALVELIMGLDAQQLVVQAALRRSRRHPARRRQHRKRHWRRQPASGRRTAA